MCESLALPKAGLRSVRGGLLGIRTVDAGLLPSSSEKV